MWRAANADYNGRCLSNARVNEELPEKRKKEMAKQCKPPGGGTTDVEVTTTKDGVTGKHRKSLLNFRLCVCCC
jgi:hypothetical protein